MCPFDLIEVFQHNYRAFRAKSTATNQRCWVGGGAGRQSKPLKLIMRLSVARTHTHSHSCGHLTLRHFVAFAYAWGPCGVYATSGTCNNYQAAAATATAAALVLKGKGGTGRRVQKQCLGAIKTQAIKWIFMPHFRNACSVAHISRLPFFLLLYSAPKTAQANNAAKRVVSSCSKVQVSWTMQVCKCR